MTCIVGLVVGDQMWIGGDSISIEQVSQACSTRLDAKVICKNNILIGFCGSFRMWQILRYHTSLPKPPKTSILKWMCTEFVPILQESFSEHKYKMLDDDSFLVGVGGKFYTISSDFQVEAAEKDFEALGIGKDLAKGALFASDHLPPQKRILTALKAAETFNAYVRGPFHVRKCKVNP